MEIKDLSNIEFEDLIECFLNAFKNYFVEMPQDVAYYRNRWKAANVDYKLSYGMFDNGLLVGFIIHAIGTKDGNLTAYNTATGVIPKYRGQKIIKSICTYAFPILKEKGIKCCTLEVITENTIALKTYKRIGFKKSKRYICYAGNIKQPSNINVRILEKPLDKVDWSTLPNQNYYSWDNRKESIMLGQYRYYEIIKDGNAESYYIIDIDRKYVTQCDVFVQNPDAWVRLFAGIAKLTEFVRTNNVDDRLDQKIEALNNIGLDAPAEQYEMCLFL